MKKLIPTTLFLITLAILSSCDALTGTEVGRLAINEVSTNDSNLIIKEASLDLLKDESISIWSDMDMEYEGDVEFRFRMEILKDGVTYGNLEIDPTDKNVTIGGMKTEIMGKTDWSFTGRNKSLTIEEDGHYTFRALLAASDNPSLNLKKAELVLKK